MSKTKLNQKLKQIILDMKIYTPQELQYELDLGNFFIEEIIEQGKTIYEKKE